MDNKIKCPNHDEFLRLRDKVEEQESRIVELEKNHTVQEIHYKNIMGTLEEMKRDIIDIKMTPHKRWDLVITGIITAVVAFLASNILG